MTQILLPIILFTVPVLVIVLLATAFGRRLGGSCGGVDPDGKCSRCGRAGDDARPADASGECSRV